MGHKCILMCARAPQHKCACVYLCVHGQAYQRVLSRLAQGLLHEERRVRYLSNEVSVPSESVAVLSILYQWKDT